ncbi:CLUMA_CG011594, isoform A [Clunio marinus]|uniref:Innexin n=1 Tax=Clunio marinus TaxID=568069 RepID=A0A1J1ID66_9DIPT|nr:CLUMA_CG011594, isoform A [Clunio marinus]
MIKDIIQQLVSNSDQKVIKTSGFIFKLLTCFTVNILLCSVLLISANSLFGGPIDCQVNGNLKSTIETKCWIEGVYLDGSLFDGTKGKDITRYGVGPSKKWNENNLINQSYYQWVVPVLGLIALLMYMPRVIWHHLENGLMDDLLRRTCFQYADDALGLQWLLIFPTQAKCFYYDFGPSGGAQERDALCFLPQNVINEKIFVFLYIWFAFAFFATLCGLMFTSILMFFKCLRTRSIRGMVDRSFSHQTVVFSRHYRDYGDWFILHLLHMNLSPVLFDDLVSDLMKPLMKNSSKSTTCNEKEESIDCSVI